MFELDKNNFAKFLAEQRKAKGYTQKTLAEKLYVSDKAVSKWERSLSMPDISLLIPLAEILEVSVTELLEGRKLSPDSEMNAEKVEELVKKALTMSEETPADRLMQKERRRKSTAIFSGCTLLMILEALAGMWLLYRLNPETESTAVFMASLGGLISILVLGGLSFVFGIYFWFFIKTRLPRYYDENRISVYTDGAFNLSLPGIAFNNNNWPHITRALRAWSAVTMATAPLVCLLPAFFAERFPVPWLPFCLQMASLALYLAGEFMPLYKISKKYGSTNGMDADSGSTADICTKTDSGKTPSGGNRQRKRRIVFILAMLLLTLSVSMIGSRFGTERKGVRTGYVEHGGLREWSASYRLLNGTMSRTIYPPSGSQTYIVETETTQGALSIEMTDNAGNIIFSAEDIRPGVYEVTLAGATKVKITGKNHVGSFSIVAAYP